MTSDLILSGIVGSTAYGLARGGSDVDRLGVFVAPTLDVAGLNWPPSRETRATSAPDVTVHEIGKALRLMLKCNPTVLEMLYLPAYEVLTDEGQRLIDIRSAFLSEPYIRDAYGGYAKAQATKLASRGEGYFSSSTKNRTAKHGRHLLRLLRQGRELLSTGTLTVVVDNPEEYWAFDRMAPAEMLELYAKEAETFTATPSILPATPDSALVSAVLDSIRTEHLGSR